MGSGKRGVKVTAFERKRPIIAILAAAACMVAAPAASDAVTPKKAVAVRKKSAGLPRPVVTPEIDGASKTTARPIAAMLLPQARPIGQPGDWFPIESYPADARVAGQEGRTVFALDIDARGRITACHILATSGSDLLDSTTCSQLIANGQFEPAHDANGKAVAGQWRSAMRWQLASGASSEPDQ